MAIGGTAGYLTVNPTENYVGQAIQGLNENFARVRAEKYQREKDKLTVEQNLREQRRQDFNDSAEFNAKYPYASLGDNDKQFVIDLKKTYTDAKRDVINTGSEKSQALADKALSNLERLESQKKAMSIKAEEMLKNEKDYNPTSFNKAKDLVARVRKDLITRLDENGNVVSDLVKRDDNGVVIGVEKKDISDAELKQMFDIVPKFDVTGEKGMNAQFIKMLKSPTVNSDTKGTNKTTTSSYPEAPVLAETFASEAVKDNSAIYYALEKIKVDADGKPIVLDPEDKSNYSNPKVLELVKSYYKNNLLGLAPTGVQKEKDFSEANYNLNATKEANSQKNEKIRIEIAKEVAGKDKKGIRLTVKNGIMGKETSATMNMTDQEYTDYLMENGVEDVKTMEEIWNNPINAGYSKVAKSSPAKPTKTPATQKTNSGFDANAFYKNHKKK